MLVAADRGAEAVDIDKHPLCPTVAKVAATLDGLADLLGKIGCTVLRTGPKLPDLALTTRIYAEQLYAFYGANLPAETHEAVSAAAGRCRPTI